MMRNSGQFRGHFLFLGEVESFFVDASLGQRDDTIPKVQSAEDSQGSF